MFVYLVNTQHFYRLKAVATRLNAKELRNKQHMQAHTKSIQEKCNALRNMINETNRMAIFVATNI